MEAEKPGTSGKRLAIAIILIGLTAGVAALFFREFSPRIDPNPTTQQTQ